MSQPLDCKIAEPAAVAARVPFFMTVADCKRALLPTGMFTLDVFAALQADHAELGDHSPWVIHTEPVKAVCLMESVVKQGPEIVSQV